MSIKALLLSMPTEEMNSLEYGQLCDLRAAAFAEHVQAMEIPAALKTWDSLMKAKYGDRIKVWNVVYDSFLVALMVVRYGEAISFWPEKFSTDDLARAVDWESGKSVPSGISYPRTSIGRISMHLLIWSLVAGCLMAMGFSWEWLLMIPFVGTAMTDYLENKLADHIFRTTTYSQPAALAVALYTAAPGETGGGTEVSGGSYARVSNNPANANWNGTHGTTSGASSGTGGVISNAGSLTFPTPSANWGTVTHMGLLDATSGGNLLIYGALTASKTVNNGDPAPSFAATALAFTFA